MIRQEYIYKGISYRLLSIKECKFCLFLNIEQVYRLIYNNCFKLDISKMLWSPSIKMLITFIFFNSFVSIAPHLLEKNEQEYLLMRSLIETRKRESIEDSFIQAIVSIFHSINPLDLEKESFPTILHLYDLAVKANNNKDLLDLKAIKNNYYAYKDGI